MFLIGARACRCSRRHGKISYVCNYVDEFISSEQEIAQKLISANSGRDKEGRLINPMDANFESLGLEWMLPIKNDCKEYASLQAYAKDSHGDTHHFKIQIQHAFRVQR